MRNHRFPPDERGHLAIGLVVEDTVQRVLRGSDAALRAIPFVSIRTVTALILIHMQRQTGDGFRDHPHTGVDRAHLNGGARRD